MTQEEIYDKPEYILCVAIHNFDDCEMDMAGHPLIYCGIRHANILWQGKHVSRNPHHQGFLTSKGRFVNRQQAALIAFARNQISEIKKTLYSEDLY